MTRKPLTARTADRRISPSCPLFYHDVPAAQRARRVLLILTSVGLALALTLSAVPAQEPSGTIVGVIAARETGEPLPYSVVAVASLSIHRFSNDSGAFVLRDVPAGPRVVEVRRLGYAPRDVSILVRPGVVDSVRIELTRVALTLAAVHVRADPVCTRPGLRAINDSALATVLTQLRMNGEQYRLLAESYPFVYVHERMTASKLKNGDMRTDAVDTVMLGSKQSWRYRPGSMLTRLEPRRRGNLFFHIPTLPDFADSLFLNNHCFTHGGIENVGGRDLIRIDVVASARIKEPDVNGSIYLDPRSFQIRRSILRLSRNPKVRGLTGLEVTTVFQEALESIPIISQVQGVQTFDGRDRRRDHIEAYEYHDLIAFNFLGARPGEDPTKP
jgi:hypothetical protein